MDAKKSIEALQFFATGLTEGALVHKLQGQIFKSQGFEKIGQKYIDHFNEEMEWVEVIVNYPSTYEIMVGYLKDEEEDLYWSQGALEMIECIGAQNWLIRQL